MQPSELLTPCLFLSFMKLSKLLKEDLTLLNLIINRADFYSLNFLISPNVATVLECAFSSLLGQMLFYYSLKKSKEMALLCFMWQ